MEIHEKSSAPEGCPDETAICFEPSVVLASVTDLRGIIKVANDQFCQVSGYPLDDLVGAPHKLVRDPSMPKGLFYLIWKRLKEDKPVCAYIRNRAIDGRYYDTFASIFRAGDLYWSVRVKPMSEHFSFAIGLYRELSKREENGLTVDRSASLFLELLDANGYSDYQRFMLDAMEAEVCSRGRYLPSFQEVKDKVASLSELTVKLEEMNLEISRVFRQIKGEPINLRILASRMGASGPVISEVAKNYEKIASDLHQAILEISEKDEGELWRLGDASRDCLFYMQLSKVVELNVEQMMDANQPDVMNFEFRGVFSAAINELDCIRTDLLDAVKETSVAIPEVCRLIRRRVNGLELVKLLCKVEGGRSEENDEALWGIIDRIEIAHRKVNSLLDDFTDVSSRIEARARRLNRV